MKALSELNLESFKALEHAPAVQRAEGPVPAVRPGRSRPPGSGPTWCMWAALGLAIDAALFAAILALDAQFLEAAAAGSERFYAKLERMRKGGPLAHLDATRQGLEGRPAHAPLVGRDRPDRLAAAHDGGPRLAARRSRRSLAALGLAGIGVYLGRTRRQHTAIPASALALAVPILAPLAGASRRC